MFLYIQSFCILHLLPQSYPYSPNPQPHVNNLTTYLLKNHPTTNPSAYPHQKQQHLPASLKEPRGVSSIISKTKIPD